MAKKEKRQKKYDIHASTLLVLLTFLFCFLTRELGILEPTSQSCWEIYRRGQFTGGDLQERTCGWDGQRCLISTRGGERICGEALPVCTWSVHRAPGGDPWGSPHPAPRELHPRKWHCHLPSFSRTSCRSCPCIFPFPILTMVLQQVLFVLGPKHTYLVSSTLHPHCLQPSSSHQHLLPRFLWP